MWQIIPDIHGDNDRLERSLAMAKDARSAFLGDFIDASEKVTAPDDAAVLRRIRTLVENEGAVAVMGNHELNAILYHRRGTDGHPLRKRSDKNAAQHASFLARFGTETPEALDWTDWFLTLPLWLDLGGLRLVHACWSDPHVALVAERRPDARLQAEDLEEIAQESSAFGRAVKTLVSGPEAQLPAGASFLDFGRHRREEVRLAWWRSDARTWRGAVLSVPDPSELPDALLPGDIQATIYPDDAAPVLVGHYKMAGLPELEAANAACLDYPSSPCVYHWRGEPQLLGSNLLIL